MQLRRPAIAARAPRFLRTGAAAGAILWLLHTFLNGLHVSLAGGDCPKKCTCTPQSSGLENPNDSAVWMYTANYDEAASAIDIVGATALQPYAQRAYYCHVWSEHDDGECAFPAEVANVPSVRQKERNSPLTVHRCRYPNYIPDLHTRVAVTGSASCQRQTNRGISVHGRGAFVGQRAVQFAVCCLPEWDAGTMNIDPENLISFIETNALLGAGKFYFYNTTSSTNKILDKVLAYYKAKDLIAVVQWTASSALDSVTLPAARQDCLHRSRAEAEYVVYLSVYDVLVPAEGTTWNDVIRRALPASPAAYQFTSVQLGVPSPSPCPVRNSTLAGVAAKVKSLQYTLFSGVTAANSGDRRFYRMMYNLAKVRSHPSLQDNWLGTTDNETDVPGQRVVLVDAKSASIKNYDGPVILADRKLRVQPLRYSPSLCQHSNLILEKVLRSCASCTN